MKIKGLQDEDFVNYRKPSLFLGTIKCDWKCCIEQSLDISVCQNSSLINSDEIEISVEDIYQRYIKNPITRAIVIGGLEPFLQFDDLKKLINIFRKNGCEDDFVIYTGYYEKEIEKQIQELAVHRNIIVKFGRYIPNQRPHFDDVLGVHLSSDNQFAMRIS